MIRYLLTKLSISQLKKIRNIVNLALSKKLQYELKLREQKKKLETEEKYEKIK